MFEKMRLVDIEDLDHYLVAEDVPAGRKKTKFQLPDEIGILPIRSAVAYPGTVMPLAIGRSRSKRLVKDMVPHETIFGLVTQMDVVD